MAEKITANFAIVALIISLLLSFNKTCDAGTDGILPAIKNYFFPEIEITLFNDGDYDVLYTCGLTQKDKGLYVLRKGEKFSYKFTQVAFPMRWCYLYINDKFNGFFWSYNVRLRCTKCFWRVNSYPYLYRSDRTRWERQVLHMPQNFNIHSYMRNSSSEVKH